MKTLKVDLGDRTYPIYIGSGLMRSPEQIVPHIVGRQVLIVTNETVAPLYLQQLKSLLVGFDVAEVVLPDGEQYKTLEVLNTVFDALLAARHNRSTTLIALGGGVIGDMAGFAASAYQRGVNFIQVPTTLLSQVDSSVGGKTGVNHPLGKNMIGAFYQPKAVMIDVDSLRTLPSRELSAGVAEVIKYGLICDLGFYCWLEENIERVMSLEPEAVSYAIEVSCSSKAKVVASDETEKGLRAILNLGHTFGHAIESARGYGNWLHGEAVAAGMVMALVLSAKMGNIAHSEVQRLKRLLDKAGLPLSGPAEMTVDDYLSYMQVDKKNIDGNIRLVLLKAVGDAYITDDYPKDLMVATIQECTGSSI